MTTPNFSRFDLLTFDCYGTLIDWEQGILNALQPLLSRHGITITDECLLEMYAGLESEVESREYRTYREVLSIVMRMIADKLEFRLADDEIQTLSDSIRHWPPFPDTVESLNELQKRFKLGIISNIDDALFAGSNEQLRVTFDHIVTAQQAGTYKPSLEMFKYAFTRIATPRERILHVAQSRYHDIAPCNALGMPCVWVNRRRGKGGSGATPATEATPTWEVGGLKELVGMVV